MSYLLIIAIFLLPILYEGSPVFRYYFKSILYYVLLTLHSLALIPLFILRGRDVRNLVIGTRLTKWITHLLGVRWTLKSGELLEDKPSCIIISNHQTSLDILGMFQFWPDKMTVVAKKMLMYVGPFGLASWLCKLMFIDRSQGQRSRQLMYEAMKDLIAEETKLWIFPEGTRRNKNQIHEFKKGAFYLAVQHQIPLQPLVYSSYLHFLNDDKKKFDSGEIIMTVMPRISTEGLTEADIPALIEKAKKLMEQVYMESTQEAIARASASNVPARDSMGEFKVRLDEAVKGTRSQEEEFVKGGGLLKGSPPLEKTIN